MGLLFCCLPRLPLSTPHFYVLSLSTFISFFVALLSSLSIICRTSSILPFLTSLLLRLVLPLFPGVLWFHYIPDIINSFLTNLLLYSFIYRAHSSSPFSSYFLFLLHSILYLLNIFYPFFLNLPNCSTNFFNFPSLFFLLPSFISPLAFLISFILILTYQ